MNERIWWSRKGGVRGSKHSFRRGSKEKFDHDTLLGAAIVNKEIKAPDRQLCYAVVH